MSTHCEPRITPANTTCARSRPRVSGSLARAALVLVALVAMGLVAGCASAPRHPWVLSSDELKTRPTRDIHWIASYPVALASVLEIMHGIGLPELQVRLVFVPDDASFEAVLRQIGYRPGLAHDLARITTAMGGHRMVLVNEGRLGRQQWLRRITVLAHELAHVVQYELGGGTRGTSAQWLREGFADCVAVRVLESLHVASLTEATWLATVRLREQGAAARARRLAALDTFPAWIAQAKAIGGDAVADHAFVATEELVKEQGLDKVLRYFSLFAARQDAAANFMDAFGQTEDAFDIKFRAAVWGRSDRGH